MARRPFNLDEQVLDNYTVLVHGGRGAGKTHLEGDMLLHESKTGLVRFINVLGEDGTLTLKGNGLGNVGETIESYEDFIAAMTEFAGLKLQAVGIDSLKALERWITKKVVGSDRLPRIEKNGPNEWGELHRERDNAMMVLRRAAKLVMATCPSDRSVDQLTGATYITPDLPGRAAVGIGGSFDFVGFLRADVVGLKKVKRTLMMGPSSTILTRQRIPKQIVEDIVLPEGAGGWLTIKTKIEEGWK